MKNSQELQPSRPPQPPEGSFFMSTSPWSEVKCWVDMYLGVGVYQLDVVVEHVKGGFHLTRNRLSYLNLCKLSKRWRQNLTATRPFMSACCGLSPTFNYDIWLVWLDSDQDLEVAGLGEVDVDNVDLVLHPRLLPCQTQGAHPFQDSHNDVATDEEFTMCILSWLFCLMESARNQNLGPTSGSLVIKWSAVVKILSSPPKLTSLDEAAPAVPLAVLVRRLAPDAGRCVLVLLQVAQKKSA